MSNFLLDDLVGETLPQNDRLRILYSEKYELLWGYPRFTQTDRDPFYTVAVPEREIVEKLRSIRTKIYFLLHLGNFRALQDVVRSVLAFERQRLADALTDCSIRRTPKHWTDCSRTVRAYMQSPD